MTHEKIDIEQLVVQLKQKAKKYEVDSMEGMPTIEVRSATKSTQQFSELEELDDKFSVDWLELVRSIECVPSLPIVLPLLMKLQDQHFIEFSYLFILQRPVDEQGLESMLKKLQQCDDRRQIFLQLLTSAEYRKKQGLNIILTKKLWLAGLIKHFLPARISQKWVQKCLQSWLEQSKSESLVFQEMLIEKLRLKALINVVRSMAQEVKGTGALQALIEQHSNEYAQLQARFQYLQFDLENRVRDFLNSGLERSSGDKVSPVVQQFSQGKYDAFYVAFEDACRGSLEQIKQQQSVYLPYILQAAKQADYGSQPVLDIGCGRGEWLGLLKENGYFTKGVDINVTMTEVCRDKQLDVECQDVLGYLRNLPSESILAVTGFHIIEHLPFELLFDVVHEIHRVLVKRGKIIFETPNPENVLVGSHTFYHDPTHRNPITPTFITFLTEYHGFAETEILRLHPYPESAKVPGFDPLTERVNGHLCSSQDFAIIATKVSV